MVGSAIVSEPGDLWVLLWGSELHVHEVHLRHDGEPVCCWIPCHHRDRLLRLLDAPDCWVSAVPRRYYKPFDFDSAHLLWAQLQTPESCRCLEAFSPTPSLVWRSGRSANRWAAWGLSQPLRRPWIQQATERLAHALKARRRAARPQTLMPSPFSDNWAVEFAEPEIYTPRQVVGHLIDAPPPYDWRAKAA